MFKDRLVEALELRDMKAIELSEKTGISRGNISNYISGRMEPKSVRLHNIAKALNVQEAWLMGYDVDMDRPETKEDMASEIEKMYNLLSPEDQKIVSSLIRSLVDKKSEG